MLRKVVSFFAGAVLTMGIAMSGTADVAAENVKSVEVYAAGQMGEEWVTVPKKVKVSQDLSDRYGYEDAVTDGVSVLDVLIEEHIRRYGADFTKESKEQYLSVSSGGWITKMFQEDASSGFAVNGKAPHDDVMTDYGYTGYTVNQAQVADQDIVSFFFYQDQMGWSDQMSVMDVKQDTIQAGSSITGKVSGYSYAWYGSYDDATIAAQTKPLENVSVNAYHLDTQEWFSSSTAQTDSEGAFSLKLNQAGEYLITVSGSNEEQPLLKSFQKVTVLVKPAITLNYKSLSLQKGQSTTVVAIAKKNVKTDKIASATADKKNIVSLSVKNGTLKITGKNTGKVNVTVQAKSGAKATVRITVQKTPVKVTKVEPQGRRNIILKKNQKTTVKVNTFPVTAKAQLNYTSSKKSVATVSSKGVVKAIKKGKAVITVKDVNGKKTTFTVTVK